MPRRRSSAEGLRGWLISDRVRFQQRWGIPGVRDEFLDALHAGEPVVISSATVMAALIHAGQPCGEYCFGGKYFQSSFLLDERDQLSEVSR